jgi:hypothetical protein
MSEILFFFLLKESTMLWDIFYEAKEAIMKGNNSSSVGHLNDFFKEVDFEKLRKDIKKEHKDEAMFNWIVATKILQPLSGGLVFIDKIPKSVNKSQCDKVVHPASDKIVKGLAFGKKSKGSDHVIVFNLKCI